MAPQFIRAVYPSSAMAILACHQMPRPDQSRVMTKGCAQVNYVARLTLHVDTLTASTKTLAINLVPYITARVASGSSMPEGISSSTTISSHGSPEINLEFPFLP